MDIVHGVGHVHPSKNIYLLIYNILYIKFIFYIYTFIYTFFMK